MTRRDSSQFKDIEGPETNPEKDRRTVKGSGAQFLRGGTEQAGFVQPGGKEAPQERPHPFLQTPGRRLQPGRSCPHGKGRG